MKKQTSKRGAKRGPNYPSEINTVTVSARVEKAIHDQLDEMAKYEGRSVSNFLKHHIIPQVEEMYAEFELTGIVKPMGAVAPKKRGRK